MFITPVQRRAMTAMAEGAGVDPVRFENAVQKRFSEDFLALISGAEIVSIDASSYEGATHVVDLNDALQNDSPLRGSADWVLDIGTTEHVYDVRAAIRNILAILKPDGMWAADLPTNQMSGHGLYQFSPALPYSLVKTCPGLSFLHPMLIREGSHNISQWRQLPLAPKVRVPIQSVEGAMISFAIIKSGALSDISKVQQFDYEELSWMGEENAAAVSARSGFEGEPPKFRTRLKQGVKSSLREIYFKIFVLPYLKSDGLYSVDKYKAVSPPALITSACD